MKTDHLHNLHRRIIFSLLIMLGISGSSYAQCSTAFTTTYDSTGNQLTFFATVGGGNATSYDWDFGDGNYGTSQTPTHSYNYYGYALVCVTVNFSGGCFAQWCDSILTQQNGGVFCNASFNYSGSPSGFLFYDQSQTSDSIVSYSWDFGDGSTSSSANPNHFYQNRGTYTVCQTITTSGGCTDTYCSTISVQTNFFCYADFSSAPVSGTTIVDFTNASVLDTTIVSYEWDFGDSLGFSNLENPSYSYATPGIYTACLTITTSSGCTSRTCHQVNSGNFVFCQANFFASFNPGTNSIDFYNQSSSSDSIISINWDFGDGSTGTGFNTNHQYTTPGTYAVCMTITTSGGCTDTYCDSVISSPPQNCSADFYTQISGSSTTFYPDYFSSTATYSWDFGDGNTTVQQGNSVISHQYANTGDFEVCLTVMDANCSASNCDTISIGTNVVCFASFGFTIDSTGNEFTFIDYSSPSTNYQWSFGDGTASTLQNPVHLYNNPGPHTVCLTVTDSTSGCTDTFCRQVSAANICDPVFTAVPDTSTVLGVPMSFTIYSPCGIPGTVIVDFGDGNTQTGTSTSFSYTYANAGTYQVCVCTVIGTDTTCFCDTITAYRVANSIAELENLLININTWPNPFSSVLNVEYTLEKSAAVQLRLLGISGNSIVDGSVQKSGAGTYRTTIQTSDLASGFYILQINVNGNAVNRKLILQR